MKLARGLGGVENKASGDTPYVASLANGRLNLNLFSDVDALTAHRAASDSYIEIRVQPCS
jgi:hypothetical protein